MPIDFKVGSELYSRYRLEDGSILLAKYVVTKFFLIPDTEPGSDVRYHNSSSFVLTSICPPSLRGKPTIPAPTLDALHAQDSVAIKATVEEEPWNYYDLIDGTSVFSKIRVTGVKRTKSFAADGDPIYLVDSQTFGFRIAPDNTYFPMKGLSFTLPPQRSQSIPE